MSKPQFEFVTAGPLGYAINDHGRTVATVSNHGDIDWLLKSPLQDGEQIRAIIKETHLANTRGLKITLFAPNLTDIKGLTHEIRDGGATLLLRSRCESSDGKFASETVAILHADESFSRYQWDMETTVTCQTAEPAKLDWLEYCNVYPRLAGYGFLYAPQKQFDATIMIDRDKVAWKFPHQHMFHYTCKISQLHFAEGSMAGFFGEKTGSPVVVVQRASIPPDWAICDMYFDLHCGARPAGPIQPGEQHAFAYTIKYIGAEEAEQIAQSARPIPIDRADRESHNYPRLELGLNTFSDNVKIDRLDDAAGFRPCPPQKVWDREVGHRTKGSLRITNEKPELTVWGCEPYTCIPPETKLRIAARIKTQRVEGRGAYIRVRYFTFDWLPTPHVVWARDVETKPVTGTTGGWVRVEAPEITVPKNHIDYLIHIEVVLDGQGVAWFTDVDIDLQPAPEEEPRLEAGHSKTGLSSISRLPPSKKSASVGATA